MAAAMGYQCVECGFAIRTLYVQYSPGNIRLMKCENCKSVADEYIECEFMIILIDLILHKPKAYRHLLFNVLNQKSAVIEVFMACLVGNSLFLCVFLLATRILLNSSLTFSRFRDLLLVILVSSYFKIFLIAMMVWEFPLSVILIIDLFVVSSNTVALKVTTGSSTARCLGVCFSAHCVKLIATHALELPQIMWKNNFSG
ncbi:unnamed protein product [Linum tenue]|uniref:Protein ARV n=1 Tax=Linum tenue TaxID=586396 RepID=A0AAV0NNS3_9ROSI|nr:unnamed protein product [Linum tenue]